MFELCDKYLHLEERKIRGGKIRKAKVIPT